MRSSRARWCEHAINTMLMLGEAVDFCHVELVALPRAAAERCRG
jgi:hypothetical protein